MAVFLRVGRGGRTESFDPAKRDVEDAVPYTLRHCEPVTVSLVWQSVFL